MFWRGLEFHHPGYWVLLLLVIPIVFMLLKLYRDRQTFSSFFRVHPRRSPMEYLGAVTVLCLLWILVVVTLMDPIGNPEYLIQEQKSSSELFFVIDTSASMGVTDSNDSKSRLSMAKAVVKKVLAEVPGMPVSLVAFTSEVLKLSPLTWDHYFVNRMVDQIQINEGDTTGTDLQKVLEEVFANKTADRDRIVLLLSDGGEEPVTIVLPGGIQLITLGIGSLEGAKVPNFSVTSSLNQGVLQSLGGTYIKLDPLAQSASIQTTVSLVNKGSSLAEAQHQLSFRHYFQWPLATAIAALLWLIARQERLYA